MQSPSASISDSPLYGLKYVQSQRASKSIYKAPKAQSQINWRVLRWRYPRTREQQVRQSAQGSRSGNRRSGGLRLGSLRWGKLANCQWGQDRQGRQGHRWGLLQLERGSQLYEVRCDFDAELKKDIQRPPLGKPGKLPEGRGPLGAPLGRPGRPVGAAPDGNAEGTPERAGTWRSTTGAAKALGGVSTVW